MLGFGKKKRDSLDIEQHELLENAQRRVKQKKRLFSHFVIFLIGSVFHTILQYFIDKDEEYT
ncbi:MAG: 2TM domain-containing protein, partial [Bacteroidota bacterium]